MKRILVVEDEINIANLISYNLEQAGYNGTSFFDIVPQRWAKGEPARGLVNQRYAASAAGFREEGPKWGQKMRPLFA